MNKCDGCRYKSEHQEMGFGAIGVCYKEPNLLAAVKAYEAKVCPFAKTKTNGDHIRNMTDEELVALLIAYNDYTGEYYGGGRTFYTREEAVNAEIEWLKQPMKGNEK